MATYGWNNVVSLCGIYVTMDSLVAPIHSRTKWIPKFRNILKYWRMARNIHTKRWFDISSSTGIRPHYINWLSAFRSHRNTSKRGKCDCQSHSVPFSAIVFSKWCSTNARHVIKVENFSSECWLRRMEVGDSVYLSLQSFWARIRVPTQDRRLWENVQFDSVHRELVPGNVWLQCCEECFNWPVHDIQGDGRWAHQHIRRDAWAQLYWHVHPKDERSAIGKWGRNHSVFM